MLNILFLFNCKVYPTELDFTSLPLFSALKLVISCTKKIEQMASSPPSPGTAPAATPQVPKSKQKDHEFWENTDQLNLFREHKLEVAGDLYVKGTLFQRSKKYFAELRGFIITVFKNAHAARTNGEKIDSVVFVILVPQYDIDILQKDGGLPRIYIKCPPIENDKTLMYIKVMGGRRELKAWRFGLARAKKCVLPRIRNVELHSAIGRGGGGKVFLVRLKGDPNDYALKAISKKQAFKSPKSFRHVLAERSLMESIGRHPFLLPLQFCFQTDENLYIGTPFCPGGDLASYLRSTGDMTYPFGEYEEIHLGVEEQKKRRVYGRLPELQVCRIASEIILALEHLHKNGIVYRDLKPENVFIDSTGHVMLGDYGLAKNYEQWKKECGDQRRTASVCGTRNYLPPEMLFGRIYSYETDLWSLGIMLFRILCGAFPFEAPRSKDLFYKVRTQQPVIPSGLSRPARRLLNGLLQKDPRNRLTIRELKRHSFFASINWDAVYQRRTPPAAPDITIGKTAADALGNFELSRLNNVAVDELMLGGYGDLEENYIGAPSHRQEVTDMIVGFEYGLVAKRVSKVDPLDVKQLVGGVMRVTSNDIEEDREIWTAAPEMSTPLGFLAKVFSFDDTFSRLASHEESARSPRGVQMRGARMQDSNGR